MSTQQNKTLVRRYYEEIFNEARVEAVSDFVTADYTEVYGGVRHEVGVEGAREHIVGVRKTYPDMRITVDRQIAEGEWVVSCITARGTHLGDWMGMKATGKKVAVTGVNVDRVVGGRIAEHGGAANMLESLLEIGAVRVVGEAD